MEVPAGVAVGSDGPPECVHPLGGRSEAMTGCHGLAKMVMAQRQYDEFKALPLIVLARLK